MSEGTPHLTPVEEPEASEVHELDETPPQKKSGGRGAWILAALLAVAGVWLVYQTSQLQNENAALTQELTVTRTQLEELEAFLASEPPGASD